MADKTLFKKLSKLPIRKRVETLGRPEMSSILSALTPTEFALLFPKYYERGLPDVSGFNRATTEAARKRQKEEAGSLLDRVTALEQQSEEYASEVYHKVRRKLGLDKDPLPSLTPEQDAAFEKLKSGSLLTSSEEGKLFSKLSDEQLKSIGIDKVKDNTGREVFQYRTPEVTREEAVRKMATATGGDLKGMIDRAAAKYGIDPRIMYGIVRGESGHGDHYDKKIDSVEESYGPFQMNKKGGLGNVFQNQTGLDVADSSSLQRQADWIAKNIADRGGGDAARRWVASQWYGYGSNVGGPKEFGSRAAGGDSNWDNSWRSMGAGRGEAGPAVKPEGPNGSYTDEQINKMMGQLMQEKNSMRKQELANLLTSAGVPTASVNQAVEASATTGTATEKWASIQPLGTTNYCGRGVYALAKQIYGEQYFPGIHLGGNASDLSYSQKDKNAFSNSGLYKPGQSVSREQLTPEFINSLPPGTIISSGGGGRADGAGHIQMKVGDRWASDHWQRGFSFGAHRVNGTYKDFVIHYPSDAGTKMMQDRGLMSGVKVSPVTAPPAPPAPPAQNIRDAEVPDDKRTNKVPDTAKVLGPAAPEQTAAVPTATVKPAGPQPVKYKFDEAAFEAAVRNKYGFLASGYDRAGLISEFKGKLPEGVTYEKGILTIKDPNSPHIQSIRKDMEGEFGKDAIDKMITQVKEAPPPPAPEKKVETKPKEAPTAPAPTPAPEKKVEAPTAPAPQQTAETKPVAPEAPKPVPTAATGGSFNTSGDIAAYPIGGLKGDNTVVINKEQKPLFTMNSNESATYNPSQGKVDISPTKKPDGNIFGPSQDNVRNELQQLRTEMSSSFSDAGARSVIPQMRPVAPASSDNPTFVTSSSQQNKNWQNLAFERAMNRTRMNESGDSLNNHFSSNNTNG